MNYRLTFDSRTPANVKKNIGHYMNSNNQMINVVQTDDIGISVKDDENNAASNTKPAASTTTLATTSSSKKNLPSDSSRQEPPKIEQMNMEDEESGEEDEEFINTSEGTPTSQKKQEW
jgi:hypothetical protein